MVVYVNILVKMRIMAYDWNNKKFNINNRINNKLSIIHCHSNLILFNNIFQNFIWICSHTYNDWNLCKLFQSFSNLYIIEDII